MISILKDYVERVLVPLLDNQHQPRDRLESVIKLTITICIQLEAEYEILPPLARSCDFTFSFFFYSALLFDQVYPTLSSCPPARSVFLELLEPHFLSDRLPSLPPSVMQQWVAHYEETGRLEALERCVTHVNVSSLDLHQILTLAGHAGLYSAYLYVHTRALLDYIGPLEDLMKQLASAVHQLGPPYSEQDLKLGHTLLVYLSCCLAGQVYPVGGLIEPADARLKVKHQVLSFLTCLHRCVAIQILAANQSCSVELIFLFLSIFSFSKCAPDDEAAYPYLRLLLEFNTQEVITPLGCIGSIADFKILVTLFCSCLMPFRWPLRSPSLPAAKWASADSSGLSISWWKS